MDGFARFNEEVDGCVFFLLQILFICHILL
jgi:hypothetical protein